MKKEKRKCRICGITIGTKEHYCNLIEYKEGDKHSNAYYHVKCFRDRFINFSKIQEEANAILGSAKRVLTGINK